MAFKLNLPPGLAAQVKREKRGKGEAVLGDRVQRSPVFTFGHGAPGVTSEKRRGEVYWSNGDKK